MPASQFVFVVSRCAGMPWETNAVNKSFQELGWDSEITIGTSFWIKKLILFFYCVQGNFCCVCILSYFTEIRSIKKLWKSFMFFNPVTWQKWKLSEILYSGSQKCGRGGLKDREELLSGNQHPWGRTNACRWREWVCFLAFRKHWSSWCSYPGQKKAPVADTKMCSLIFPWRMNFHKVKLTESL